MNRHGFLNDYKKLNQSQLSILGKYTRYEYEKLENLYREYLVEFKKHSPKRYSKYNAILKRVEKETNIVKKYTILSSGYKIYSDYAMIQCYCGAEIKHHTPLMLFEDIRLLSHNDIKEYMLGKVLDLLDNGNLNKVLTIECYNDYMNFYKNK